MQKNELISQFKQWIEKNTGESFNINSPFLLVCLEEEIEQKINTSINGVTPYQWATEELMQEVLEGWYSKVKLFLQMPNNNMIFRQVRVPNNGDSKALLLEMERLVLKCQIKN